MLRRAFYYVRVIALSALLAGAAVLYLWSKSDDQRFYKFLQTPPGHALARVFKWHALPMDAVVAERPKAEMAPEEIAVRQKLETEIATGLPTHQVELTNGQVMTGLVVEDQPDYILFKQAYGTSAEIAMKIQRSQIKRLDAYQVRLPAITYRDVRFKMEFPDMKFFKAQPYSFLTDESYFGVTHAVNELQLLHRQIREVFARLIDQAREHSDIQVLFFGNENRYRGYQRQVSEDLEYAVGFYSPVIDRLVVFNQAQGDDVQAIAKHVAEREASYRANARTPEEGREITEWRKTEDGRIAGYADAQTKATIRHEGAHQLFTTLGIHSKHRAESDWLIEGLACYCETAQLGQTDAGRLSLVRSATEGGRIIPLHELLGIRGGFVKLGSDDRIAIAYSESWSLVLYLMQRENQGRFFDYMMYLRQPANLDAVRKSDPLELLAHFEGLKPAELERQWKNFVDTL